MKFAKDGGSNDIKTGKAVNPLSLWQEMKVECKSISAMNNEKMPNCQFE
jgi:hypothetical protein